MTTCDVTILVKKQDDTPDVGALVTAKLSGYDTALGLGYHGPITQTAVVDANGLAVLSLWPNELGSTASYYHFTIQGTEKTLRIVGVVPNVATAPLEQIAELPPYGGKPDGQIAIDAAVAAATAASAASATAAANSAAAAAAVAASIDPDTAAAATEAYTGAENFGVKQGGAFRSITLAKLAAWSVQVLALTGLSTASAAAVTAADTVLSGMGKLQAQITANAATINMTGKFTANYAVSVSDTSGGAFFENIAVTNSLGTAGYAVRRASYIHSGDFSSGVNEIGDALIMRWTSISSGSTWGRWDVVTGPLPVGSGLTGAPTLAQSFAIVSSEVNPQNRSADPGGWKPENRLNSNWVAGQQMVAETQDFSALLGGTRIGFNIAFGYALAKSPYTANYGGVYEHAKFYNAMLVNPNAIGAGGFAWFATGFKPYPVSVTIAAAGSGYTAGDILTLNTGTDQNVNQNSQVKVLTVNGSGAVLTAELWVAGSYVTAPAFPQTTTGGTGTGATFNATMATYASVAPRAALGLSGQWLYGIDFCPNPTSLYATFSNAAIRFGNNQFLVARNSGDSADVSIIGLSASNVVTLGSSGAATSIGGSTVSVTGAFSFIPANVSATLSPTGTGTVTINPATAGSIDNMALGGTTAAAAKVTTLTATGQVSLGGVAGAESLRVVTTASAVNYIQMAGSATGSGPILKAAGTDTNIDTAFQNKGIGGWRFTTPAGSLNYFVVNSNGTTSPANYLQTNAAAAGSSPQLQAAGTDTNVNLILISQGSGSIQARPGGTTVFTVGSSSVLSTVAITAMSGTAIPAGGTAGAGFLFSSTANFGVFFGSGAPTLSAAKGSLYLRSDGSSTATRAYINTDGATTWTNVTTAA